MTISTDSSESSSSTTPSSTSPSSTTSSLTAPSRSLELAVAAARTAIDNRGQDVQVLDTRGQTALFDYFVIATGASRRQLHAISDEIDHKLERDLHDRRMGTAGYDESRWIVLDYGSIVIHLFDANARDYYRLEELWADSPRVSF